MRRRALLQAAAASSAGVLLGADRSRAAERRPGPWSFVLLPDTQCYTESHPEVFLAQTEWIARQRQARNIQFALHLGDITNHNLQPEWINARRAVDVLRQAGVPHLLVPGNHDLGPWGRATDRTSHFSDWFIQRRARVTGDSANATLEVDLDTSRLLVVGLEFGPRNDVVAWANRVVAEHPEHHAILLTHAYTYSDDTRYDWATHGKAQSWNPHAYGVGTLPGQAEQGVHDGEELWQRLVRRHRQFFLTCNGHVLNDGTGLLASAGDAGNTVHQMLVNYQCGTVPDRTLGGGGFLRLVEVQADGRTLEVRDYSPYFDQWLTEPDRRFTLTLDRDLHAPVASG